LSIASQQPIVISWERVGELLLQAEAASLRGSVEALKKAKRFSASLAVLGFSMN